MESAKRLVSELRAAKIVDAKAGHTRAPTELETRAAAMIETLNFQLEARIQAAQPQPPEAA